MDRPRKTPRCSRPIFEVRLRAEPGIDPIKSLRAFLKAALRRYGLRAVSVTEVVNNDDREE
jgi:hypothetical protein